MEQVLQGKLLELVPVQVHLATLLQGLPLAAVTAALSLPGFLVKQIINCFQLRSSMQVHAGQSPEEAAMSSMLSASLPLPCDAGAC